MCKWTLLARSVLCAALSLQLFFVPDMLFAFEGPGAQFSDPNKSMVKSAEWQRTPIVYDSWAKGVDIAATLDQNTYPAFLPMLKIYAKKQNLEIAVREGTCGTSEGLLNRKQVDIGGFCCPPAFSDRLPGLQFHTIGISSLAILLHPDNPVKNLSAKQVRAIFSGEISNWSQIPQASGKKASNLPIRPVGRLHCSVRPGHWRSILDDADQFSSAILEVGTIPNMIAAVADYKGAIGYEVLWNLSRFQGHGKPHAITVDNVSPYDIAAVAQGNYPFFRVNNVTTWKAPTVTNPNVAALIDFMLVKAKDVEAVFALVPADKLRGRGWKFKGNELIGTP